MTRETISLQIHDKARRKGFVKARPLQRFTAQVHCACASRRLVAKAGKTGFGDKLETLALSVLTTMHERAAVFDRMCAEGRAHTVQYMLPQPSLTEWMACTAPEKAWICVLSESGREAAAVWITDFTGRAALFHFVVFRGFERLTREMCLMACRWAFDGWLACLMGIIPAVNRAALAAMAACGWKEVFRIPQACYVHRLGRHVDGALCHFTPKLLREAMQ